MRRALLTRPVTLDLAPEELDALDLDRCAECGHIGALHYDDDGSAGCLVDACVCLGGGCRR